MTPGRSITWAEIQRARSRLSRESGCLIKDWGGKLPFALVYPNSYFIGMSNLGLQVIYGFLNGQAEVLCERVFWDKENRESGVMPVSVESQRPLSDFAVLAFSLNYELDFLNVVPILKSCGFPLYSQQRDASLPLIIAGGPCITANPMPVAPFFDCLCIGEAEAILPSMLPVIQEGISGNRESLLKTLASVPGVFQPRYNRDAPVQRQYVKDLESFPAHSNVLTSDTELGDMYLMEVERGCAHSCRFCLVSQAFNPMRFHSLESITGQAREGLKRRKRLGLIGPAVTDHPRIENLLEKLLDMGAQFSLSSLRMTSLTSRLVETMLKGGMQSLAIAPEAGTDALRLAIKKGVSQEDVLRTIELVASKGLKQLKLYFMLGLPDETEEDITAIAELALAGKKAVELNRGKTRLTLNLSPFVPKAGTPFQRLPLASLATLQGRISYLKNRLAGKGIQVKNESPQWSQVQAVLSRGNSDLAGVLEEVDRESLPAWRAAIEKQHFDVDYYAHHSWDAAQKLPWENIQSTL